MCVYCVCIYIYIVCVCIVCVLCVCVYSVCIYIYSVCVYSVLNVIVCIDIRLDQLFVDSPSPSSSISSTSDLIGMVCLTPSLLSTVAMVTIIVKRTNQ